MHRGEPAGFLGHARNRSYLQLWSGLDQSRRLQLGATVAGGGCRTLPRQNCRQKLRGDGGSRPPCRAMMKTHLPSSAVGRFDVRAPARDSYNLPSDILGCKNKIYASACDCALRHIRLPGRVKPLCDGNAPYFLYGAQRRCSISIIARDNHSDKLAGPVLRQGTQKNRNHVGPSPGLRYRL